MDFKFARQYLAFLFVVIATYWLPILLFRGHPIADQFVASSILLVVVALSPLFKLRSWASLPITVVLGLALLIGHSYVAYDVFGFDKADFDPLWAFPMLVYFVGGAWGLQRIVLGRQSQTL